MCVSPQPPYRYRAGMIRSHFFSIFVITVVMGDFITIGIMGGQQIPSIGKIIYVEMSYLQLPAAAANAVILLALTLLIIWIMTKMIDIRKEL